MTLLFGCDVSSYQPATLVPWADDRIAFGLVKFSEGDTRAAAAGGHVAALRKANKLLGAYHFFHPECSARSQFEALDTAANVQGYGGKGDIVPAVDVEYFRGHGVTKQWCEQLQPFVDMLTEAYDALPLIYMNASTFYLLGEPSWLLRCPLWVPYFSREGCLRPAALPLAMVPGHTDNWAIWQQLGGKLLGTVQDQKCAGAVDQNWAKRLPLVGDGDVC